MTDRIVEYSVMAGAAYTSTRSALNQIPYPAGWDELDPAAGLNHREDSFTGFEAAAFTQGVGATRQIA